jgi:hypothetical protein
MRFSVSERVDLAAIILKKCDKNQTWAIDRNQIQCHLLSQEEPVFDDSIDISPRHRYLDNCWIVYDLRTPPGDFGLSFVE